MRTPEEMFPIVEDWQASGQLQKEYSHEHGIPKHILSYWVCRYRSSQGGTEDNTTSFNEIKMDAAPVGAVPVGATPSKNIELILPNGIIISIPAGALSQISPLYLHRLLQLCSG